VLFYLCEWVVNRVGGVLHISASKIQHFQEAFSDGVWDYSSLGPELGSFSSIFPSSIEKEFRQKCIMLRTFHDDVDLRARVGSMRTTRYLFDILDMVHYDRIGTYHHKT
jgi:hypothetical protein